MSKLTENIWVFTSKRGKLHRGLLLQAAEKTKEEIFDFFSDDIKDKELQNDLEEYSGVRLIQDLPYYIKLDSIKEENYLFDFKETIMAMIESRITPSMVTFKDALIKTGIVNNLEKNESIKFIGVLKDGIVYFLALNNSGIVKNKSYINFGDDINTNVSVFSVPRGIQIPTIITAKLDIAQKTLFVYDVNKFEGMLSSKEQRITKSKKVLENFESGEYKVSKEEYSVKGLLNDEVWNVIENSNRSLRRLVKYDPSNELYEIEKIESAVKKLVPNLRVDIDADKKIINVTPETVKTFVAIIHNNIVLRLISGDVELGL